MKPMLSIQGYEFLLKDAAHLQTVLKVLGEATLLRYDEHRKVDRQICYYVEGKPTISVELIDERRISRVKTTAAIEAEIIEEGEELTTRPLNRRRRESGRQPKAIDFQEEFAKLKAFNEGAREQLLIGSGGNAA